MKIVFKKEEIVSDLPGIIVISHGALAPALLSSAEMIIGAQKNMAAFSFENGDTPEAFRAAVAETIEAYPDGSVVLADLFGGTPCNQLVYYMMASGKRVYALAGVSLPMLVEAVSLREDTSGEELLAQIEKIGMGSIVNLTARLKH